MSAGTVSQRYFKFSFRSIGVAEDVDRTVILYSADVFRRGNSNGLFKEAAEIMNALKAESFGDLGDIHL